MGGSELQVHRSNATSVSVRPIDPTHDARWLAFVADHPRATIFHHPAWLGVLREAFGYRAHHLACEDEHGQLLGVLPLLAQRGLVSGSRLSSLPRSPVGGPLARDAASTRALLQAAIDSLNGQRGAHLQLKVESSALDDLVPGLVGTRFRPTYVLPLPSAGEPLVIGDAAHRERIKRAVKKAARNGVIVRSAEGAVDLRAWYTLYLETMRSHAVPPRPYRFFEIAWSVLRPLGLLRLLLAEQHGTTAPRLLAGCLNFQFGPTVFYGFGGSRAVDLELRPNDAIHWRAIQDAQGEGYSAYDFGEVSTGNAGLATYKAKWGSEQRWLYRYYHPAPRELEIGLLESETRPMRMAQAVWRHLPLGITELASDWIHRYF